MTSFLGVVIVIVVLRTPFTFRMIFKTMLIVFIVIIVIVIPGVNKH